MVALVTLTHMHVYTQGRWLGCGTTLSKMAATALFVGEEEKLRAGCVLWSKSRVSRCLEIKAVLHVPTCSWSLMNHSNLLTMLGVSLPVGVLKCVFLAAC